MTGISTLGAGIGTIGDGHHIGREGAVCSPFAVLNIFSDF